MNVVYSPQARRGQGRGLSARGRSWLGKDTAVLPHRPTPAQREEGRLFLGGRSLTHGTEVERMGPDPPH